MSEKNETQATPTPNDVAESGGFKPITSQEELDRIVQARVARAKDAAAAEVRKELEGYHAPGDYDALKSERDKAVKLLAAEHRQRAARQAGLPETFADRLQGSNLDEWSADAKGLAEAMLSSAMAAGFAKPVEEPVAEGNATPNRAPAEVRGAGGGRPDAEPDMNVDDVLSKIPRH